MKNLRSEKSASEWFEHKSHAINKEQNESRIGVVSEEESAGANDVLR
jgi:hypothetical protein